MGAAKKAYGDSFGAFLTSMSMRSVAPASVSKQQLPSAALRKLVDLLGRAEQLALPALLETSGLDWRGFHEALQALVDADMVRIAHTPNGEVVSLTQRGLLLQAVVEDVVNSPG